MQECWLATFPLLSASRNGPTSNAKGVGLFIGADTHTHRFRSGVDMEQTLLRYMALNNHELPQSEHKTPIQAMKDLCASHHALFQKRSYDHPGCDSYTQLRVVQVECKKSDRRPITRLEFRPAVLATQAGPNMLAVRPAWLARPDVRG